MQMTTASGDIRPDFLENRFLQGLAGLYALIWGWAAIAPAYRFDWFLENILVFAFMAVLVLTYRRFPLSDLSYLLIFVFMALHAVGTHYTYSEVPFGFWLQELFSVSRNHFDRIVHFAFGLLLVYPAREVILRLTPLSLLPASIFAVALISSYSSLYEIIEWLVAATVNPEAGAAYLGTQGDEFDAIKDMALAMLASVLTLAFDFGFRKRRAAG